MSELPAFITAIMGDALLTELTLLVGFVLLLNIRRLLLAGLGKEQPDEPGD